MANNIRMRVPDNVRKAILDLYARRRFLGQGPGSFHYDICEKLYREENTEVVVVYGGKTITGMLHRYRKQLAGMGYNVEDLKVEHSAAIQMALDNHGQQNRKVHVFGAIELTVKDKATQYMLPVFGKDDKTVDAYLPTSLVHERKMLSSDGEIRLTIPYWLAVEKGIAFSEIAD